MGLECHIFIDPFFFKIADTVILSLTGLEGDNKKGAAKKKAKALKERAAAEALALAKFNTGLTLANLRKAKAARWATVCGERECMTCARQVENTGTMMLKCGTQDSVITQVNFALWGVAADQARGSSNTATQRDIESTIRVRAPVRAFTLQVSHESSSDLGSSA
jgi:ferredoxin